MKIKIKEKDTPVKFAKRLRNAEKRRERAKVAARSRRGRESEIFQDLMDLLPISESAKGALDKAGILRLTVCSEKLKQFLSKVGDEMGPVSEFDGFTTQAMPGFVLLMNKDGEIVYASESIGTHLGFSKDDVMGQNILQYCHHCDHIDVRNLLGLLANNKNGNDKKNEMDRKSCLLRIKYNSRKRNGLDGNFKVVHCTRKRIELAPGDVWFLMFCEPMPEEIPYLPERKDFIQSRHLNDMTFQEVDKDIKSFVGYKPSALKGKSFFEFTHGMDFAQISEGFKILYRKERSIIGPYRLLARGGGWVWVVTYASLVDGEVVCFHSFVSQREEMDQILSDIQLADSLTPEEEELSIEMETDGPEVREEVSMTIEMTIEEENRFISELLGNPVLRHTTPSTAKIFAPKTKDMEKGFLVPFDDKLIATSEAPEDLTHLAPIAGDECVSLDNIPLFDDLLAELDASDEQFSLLDPTSAEAIQFFAQSLPSISAVEKPQESIPEGKKGGRKRKIRDTTKSLEFHDDNASDSSLSAPLSPALREMDLLRQAQNILQKQAEDEEPVTKMQKLSLTQSSPGIFVLLPVMPDFQISPEFQLQFLNLAQALQQQQLTALALGQMQNAGSLP